MSGKGGLEEVDRLDEWDGERDDGEDDCRSECDQEARRGGSNQAAHNAVGSKRVKEEARYMVRRMAVLHSCLLFQIPVQIVQRLRLSPDRLPVVDRPLPLKPVLLKHPPTAFVPSKCIPHHAPNSHPRNRPLVQHRPHCRTHDAPSVVRGRKVVCPSQSA